MISQNRIFTSYSDGVKALKIAAVLISSIITLPDAGANSTTRLSNDWLAEDSRSNYYYIDAKLEQNTIETISALIVGQTWEVDLIGIDSKAPNQFRARLVSVKKDSERPPFQYKKSWFTNIRLKDSVSVSIEGDSTYINTEIKRWNQHGYLPSLQKTITGGKTITLFTKVK